MDENEKALREKIAKEIKGNLIMAMENCTCLGRDAYGDYIEKMANGILEKIKTGK